MPHSEIHGSKLILSSPWLNAEYHVLHRLLLPRHPPNALIALDLIRKKTDLNLSPCPFVSQGVASDQKHVLFPPLPSGRDFLINSHAGTDHLVSVLDLDNAIVGLDDHRTPTRARPITPIISLNDVNDAPSASCVPTGRERTKRCFLIVLDYGGA